MKTKAAQAEQTLAELYNVFGPDAVFLSIPIRTKKPVTTGWQTITPEQTQAPQYRAKLLAAIATGGNIGVRLGQNLQAIDIDDDQLMERFLEMNPVLRNTVRTRGQNGCQFFVQTKPGTYPNGNAVYQLKGPAGWRGPKGEVCGEWRCGGAGKGAQSVILGLHPDGPTYQFLSRGPIAEIDFAQLKWWRPFWEPEQTRQPARAGNRELEPAKAVAKRRGDRLLDGKELEREGFPPGIERPCFRLHRTPQKVGARSYEPGVYWHSVKDVDGQKISVNELICAPLEILATTSNPEDSEYGHQLRFTSKKGVLKTMAIPAAALMGDGLEVLQRLSEEGLWINHAHRKQLLVYIATAKPERALNCAGTTGWYQRTSFVLPDSIYGTDPVWFQSVGRIAAYAKAGALEGWRAGIADKAVGNRFLLFGISFSFAGPLLQILGLDGIGAHIYGDSSYGKTTVLLSGAATWGGGRFRHEWRTTANGIEGVAKAHTDTLLPLDEIGEVLPEDLSEIAYFLINGHGKARANRYGEARERALFRVAVLSTGEHSVRATLASAGISAKVGQTLRILDIPVEGKYGAFDCLHGEASGGVFSESLRATAAKHYGHAGPKFIEYLIKLDRSDLVKRHEDIVATFGSDMDAQTRRAARVFAAVALAGELAIEAGIVSWEKGSALDAAIDLFYLWYNARVGSGLQGEQAEILRMVADFIDAHSSGRFSDINCFGSTYTNDSGEEVTIPEQRIINRAGYWETIGDQRRYLFTADGLRESTKGKDWLRVLKALDDAGVFYEKGEDGKTPKNRRAEGRTIRLYHVDPNKLVP